MKLLKFPFHFVILVKWQILRDIFSFSELREMNKNIKIKWKTGLGMYICVTPSFTDM